MEKVSENGCEVPQCAPKGDEFDDEILNTQFDSSLSQL